METLKEKIKFEIVNILNKYDDRVLTGFSIFEEFQESAKGNSTWILPHPSSGKSTNIILLTNINQDCINAFIELKNEEKITLSSCNFLTVLAEGDFYKLPIVQKVKYHKKPHWMPILVKKGKKWPKQ